MFVKNLKIHPLKPFGFGNRLFYSLSSAGIFCLLKVFNAFSKRGPQPPAEGPFIVAANHESFLDPIVLQLAAPRRRLHFMMTSLFYFTRTLNYFSNAMRSIPVEDNGLNRDSLRLALEVLQAARPIAIFPQGGRMDVGDLSGGSKGVAFLARRSGVPVIPAKIIGTGRALPRGAWMLRPARISVLFGEPLVFEESGGERQGLDDITSRIMSAIREL